MTTVNIAPRTPRQHYEDTYRQLRSEEVSADAALKPWNGCPICNAATVSFYNRYVWFISWMDSGRENRFKKTAPYRKEWDGIPF